jgi:hypothetical protein
MTDRIKEASARFQARLAGVIALITSTSGFAGIIRGKLVVYDDAAATAHNILAHELLLGSSRSNFVISDCR